MAIDYSQVDWTRPNNAYYGMDSAGNIFTGEPGQDVSDFTLLPFLYNIKDFSGQFTDKLANVILYGYMPVDKNIKIPENQSQINVLTRYSRIGDGSMFKDYSYKDLGTILDTIYSMANSASSVQYFISSDKMQNTIEGVKAIQLPQNGVLNFHQMELTASDSSIGEDIVVATDNQLGDILNGTTISKDESLLNLIKKMFTKRTVPFTYVKPSVTFSGSNSQSVEFGTTVNVSITHTYIKNDGPNASLVTTSGTPTGSFKPLPTSTSRNFNLVVNWPTGTLANGGTLKEDSFGCYNGINGETFLTNAQGRGYAPDNDKHSATDILGNALSSCAAGNQSKTVTISGFYYMFSGYGTTEYTTLDSATIRALTKTKKANTFALNCTEGTKAIIFASPTKVTSIKQASAMNAECLESFTKDGTNPWEVDVMLADGTTSAKYYVYKYFTQGTLNKDTFNITIS